MSSARPQDEETPLLQRDNVPRKPTPLPKAQFFLLLLLRVAEPVTSYSISPYISEVRCSASAAPIPTNILIDDHVVQLVSELSITDGDKRKIGYYTGMIVRSPNTNPTNPSALRSPRGIFLPLGVYAFCHRSDHRAAMEPSF